MQKLLFALVLVTLGLSKTYCQKRFVFDCYYEKWLKKDVKTNEYNAIHSGRENTIVTLDALENTIKFKGNKHKEMILFFKSQESPVDKNIMKFHGFEPGNVYFQVQIDFTNKQIVYMNGS